MSVYDYTKWSIETELRFRCLPECWLLVANSIYARTESITPIALFDTEAMANSYLISARLPAELKGKKTGVYYRSFRPDSILWDYNDDPWIQMVLKITGFVTGLAGLPANLPPLVGPVPIDSFV